MDRRLQTEKDEFFPRGSVAFFAALLVFFSAIWLSLYSLLLSRR